MADRADDLWFAPDPQRQEQAKRICRGCPARQDCLTGAIQRREQHGIWGGALFPDEVRLAQRARREGWHVAGLVELAVPA